MDFITLDLIIGSLLIFSIFFVVPALAKFMTASYEPGKNGLLTRIQRHILLLIMELYPLGALISGLFFLLR